LGNIVKAQVSNANKKNVFEKIYWFATGIEKQGADLLIDNPSVISEGILTFECDLPEFQVIAEKLEDFFNAEYTKDQGVTGVYLYHFGFKTLAEAETKRKEMITKIENDNKKIYWVKVFSYKCNYLVEIVLALNNLL
jgi:hypothetical protein